MKLPNVENAVVDREKITDYLLNPAHPDNGCKALFFLSHGFRADHWQTLATAFRRLAETTEVFKSVASAHGQKYIVDGPLETPGGKTPLVRTVWIIDLGLTTPRLVTADPQDE